MLANAQERHAVGDLKAAAELCREILEQDPENLDAVHLMGVVFAEGGLYERAAEMYMRGLAIDDKNHQIVFNYGVAQRSLENFDDATRAFRRAVQLFPQFVDGWFNLGEVCHRQGQLVDAARCFRNVIELDANHGDGWFNLGNVELEQANLEAALDAFLKSARIDHDRPEALINAGVAAGKLAQHDEAIGYFREALLRVPDHAGIYDNLGNAYLALGQLDAAIDAYHQAIRRVPDYAAAHYNLGNAYRSANQLDAAIICYRTALGIDPNNRMAQTNLGLALQRSGRLEEAETQLSQLVTDHAATPREQGNLANVIRDRGRYAEAITLLEKALQLSPDDASLLGDMSLALQHAGRHDEALTKFQSAISLNANDEHLATNYAQALLSIGDYGAGWAAFERRLEHADFVKRLSALPGRRWHGEDISKASILVECEQGAGDAFQFVRYLPLLSRLADRVVLRAPARLARLLSTAPGADAVTSDPADEAVDFHVPLLSLPFLLGADAPLTVGGNYLLAEEPLVTRWGERLGAGTKVGLAWQGNPSYERDYARSIPLQSLDPLSQIHDLTFISLAGPALTRQDLPAWIEYPGGDVDRSDGFIDTAAIIANLDLVVTTDTSIAHLAGALGCPVWLLTAAVPDWRWGRSGELSDWYPTLRLIRQDYPEDWSRPIEFLADCLTDWIKIGGDSLISFDNTAQRS